MPSRLIQGLDSLDTCSQFSDSATLHTLTRVGGLQRAVYFSQSESNFNNFDTISYGNSSTCGCDADIKVNINLETKLNYNLQFVAKCGAHNEKVVKLSVSKYVQLLLCKSVPEHVCVSHATVKLIGIDFFNLFFFLSVYQMDLQTRNSIYQCNPTCNFEKKNKLHSSVDQPSNLFERFERERGKQRKTYLNKMVSAHTAPAPAHWLGVGADSHDER